MKGDPHQRRFLLILPGGLDSFPGVGMIQEEIEEGNSCCGQTKIDSPRDGRSHLTREKGLVTIGGKEKS